MVSQRGGGKRIDGWQIVGQQMPGLALVPGSENLARVRSKINSSRLQIIHGQSFAQNPSEHVFLRQTFRQGRPRLAAIAAAVNA